MFELRVLVGFAQLVPLPLQNKGFHTGRAASKFLMYACIKILTRRRQM